MMQRFVFIRVDLGVDFYGIDVETGLIGFGQLLVANCWAQPFFNSIKTSRATSFSVSKTPLPWLAIASNKGSSFLLSSRFSSSIAMALGRSRLLSCRT